MQSFCFFGSPKEVGVRGLVPAIINKNSFETSLLLKNIGIPIMNRKKINYFNYRKNISMFCWNSFNFGGSSRILFFYWYKKLYSYKIKTYSTCRCKYVFKIYYVKRIDIKYKYFIILYMYNIFYLITREQSAISNQQSAISNQQSAISNQLI